MTEETPSVAVTQRDQASPPPQTDGWRISNAIRNFTEQYPRRLSKGDVASLRRMTPEQPANGAFWRALTSFIEPYSPLPEDGPLRDLVERRWSAVLTAVALTDGLHGARSDKKLSVEAREARFNSLPSLGSALATAGFSELRFTRLLRARDRQLLDEVLRAARFLTSKAISFDPTDFASLIFLQRAPRDESTRRHIARHYFAAAHKAEEDTKENT